MQLEQVYIDAATYLQTELLKLALSEDIVSVLNGVTGESGLTGAIESFKKQFPEATDAAKKFDVDAMQKALQQAITGGGDSNAPIIRIPELAIFSQQVALLHELRRLVARRKSTRIERVLLAAHRRSTTGGKDGKVVRSLLTIQEQILSKLRG
jgi:hypothetical protein